MKGLTESGFRWRAAYLLVLPGVLCALAFIRPGSLSWLPFPTSCGAVTGLPCIFCGTTRAMHFLLHGNFARALYFNWLAFPLLFGSVLLYLVTLFELTLRKNCLAMIPFPRITPRLVGGILAALFALWSFQVYLAVSGHKAELLNPRGPLYSLVVH